MQLNEVIIGFYCSYWIIDCIFEQILGFIHHRQRIYNNRLQRNVCYFVLIEGVRISALVICLCYFAIYLFIFVFLNENKFNALHSLVINLQCDVISFVGPTL